MSMLQKKAAEVAYYDIQTAFSELHNLEVQLEPNVEVSQKIIQKIIQKTMADLQRANDWLYAMKEE